MTEQDQREVDGCCGLSGEEWRLAVARGVRASTEAQGLPETLEDHAVLERVAQVLGAPNDRESGAAA